MKKVIFNYAIIAALAISAVCTSCKKDDNKNENGNGNGNEVVKLVKTMTFTSNSYKAEYTYLYDDQNRITSVLIYEDGALINTETFTYSGDDLIKADMHGDDLSLDFTKSGNIITVNEMNGGKPRSSAIELNSDGYPVKYEGKGYLGGAGATYQYQDGNLTKETCPEGEGYSGFNYGFQYDNKKSPFYNCKTPKWFMILYYIPQGFGIKNNITETSWEYSHDVGSVKFEYEYDSDGYPTKMTGRDIPIEFTYELKKQ